MNIGKAHLEYDEKGKLTVSMFTSLIEVHIEDKELGLIKCTDEDGIKQQAEQVFAKWFTTMNEIELADREDYVISTEYITPCEKYENGSIKSCDILFSINNR